MYEDTADFINTLATNTGSWFSDFFWFFVMFFGGMIAFWSIIAIINAVAMGVKRMGR